MITDCLPARCLAYKGRLQEVNVSKAKVSHKSEIAGPFNRGDTIINTLHFTFSWFSFKKKWNAFSLLKETCKLDRSFLTGWSITYMTYFIYLQLTIRRPIKHFTVIYADANKLFLTLNWIFFLPRKNLPIWDPNLPTKNCRSPYLSPRKYHMCGQLYYLKALFAFHLVQVLHLQHNFRIKVRWVWQTSDYNSTPIDVREI